MKTFAWCDEWGQVVKIVRASSSKEPSQSVGAVGVGSMTGRTLRRVPDEIELALRNSPAKFAWSLESDGFAERAKVRFSIPSRRIAAGHPDPAELELLGVPGELDRVRLIVMRAETWVERDEDGRLRLYLSSSVRRSVQIEIADARIYSDEPAIVLEFVTPEAEADA